MKMYLTALAVILMVALAGCGAPPAATAEPAETGVPESGAPEQPAASPDPAASPTPDAMLAHILILVQADLAARASVDPDRIEVLNSEPVNWPDTGLGCPEPDTSYAQRVTPGYLVLLKTDEDIYQYHTDKTGSLIVFCEPGAAGPFAPVPVNPGEIDDGEPWQPVD